MKPRNLPQRTQLRKREPQQRKEQPKKTIMRETTPPEKSHQGGSNEEAKPQTRKPKPISKTAGERRRVPHGKIKQQKRPVVLSAFGARDMFKTKCSNPIYFFREKCDAGGED